MRAPARGRLGDAHAARPRSRRPCVGVDRGAGRVGVPAVGRPQARPAPRRECTSSRSSQPEPGPAVAAHDRRTDVAAPRRGPRRGARPAMRASSTRRRGSGPWPATRRSRPRRRRRTPATGSTSSRGGRFRRGRRLTCVPTVRARGSARWRPAPLRARAHRNPGCSSCASPAAVVPPGEVTAARRTARGVVAHGEQATPTPRSVWSTRMRAVSAVSPTSTPASIRASASRNTYAGPEPERPVTASRCFSGTRTTTPTAPRTRSASSRSASVAKRAAGDGRHARPARGRACSASPAPPPGAGRAASSVSIVTPAAIERIMASLAQRGCRRSRGRRATSSGFTATTTTSASATAQAGLGTTWTPGKVVFEVAAAVGVDLGHGERVGLPARRRAGPPTSASPIRPPPSSAHPLRGDTERSEGDPQIGRLPDAEGPEELRRRAHFPERTRASAPRAHVPAGPTDPDRRPGSDTLSHLKWSATTLLRSAGRRNAIRTSGWNQRSVAS